MPTRSHDEPDNSWKALAVFGTLRANLALADSFLRVSSIDESVQDLPDLGFFDVEPGEEQRRLHNSCVVTIAIAVLSQALRNYFEMKRLKPGLESPEVEGFLDDLEDRAGVLGGMGVVRNHTFHVGALDQKDRNDIAALAANSERRGGPHLVMHELLSLLYQYSEECFLGNIRIFPDQQYDDLERRKQADPQWAERWERGELTLEDLGLAAG